MPHHHQLNEALARLPSAAQQKFAQLENLFIHSDVCAAKVDERIIEHDSLLVWIDRALGRGIESEEERDRLVSQRDAGRVSYRSLVNLRDAHLASKCSARACLRQVHEFIISLADNDDIVGVRPVDTADVHLIEEGTTLRQSLKRVRLEVEKAVTEITVARQASDNPPTTEQIWTDAKLLGRLLLLEHQEENLISAAIAVGGVEVQRRSDISGWAQLGILPSPAEHKLEAA